MVLKVVSQGVANLSYYLEFYIILCQFEANFFFLYFQWPFLSPFFFFLLIYFWFCLKDLKNGRVQKG